MTNLNNLINPQVMADMVNDALQAQMKFSDLCAINPILNGRAGDSVTLPKYAYIGDASDVAEGQPIPISTLSTTSEVVKVKKAGKGITLSDESILSGYGDPLGESAKQLSLSIANKVDTDVLDVLSQIKPNMTVGDGTSPLSSDIVAQALIKFGEDVAGDKALIIAPEQLALLRQSESFLTMTDLGAATLISGAVGMIHGCQIVLSNKVKKLPATKTTPSSYQNFIVKPGAVAIYLKRETEIEKDRDITKKLSTITADKHYAVHLSYESRAIRLNIKA